MEGPLLTNNEHIVDIAIHGAYISPNDWILIEFLLNVVQIIAAIVVLALTRDIYVLIWIISYTCASIATLVILFWRVWKINRNRGDEGSCLEEILQYFFVCWVVTILWMVLMDPSFLDDTTQFFWLWVALVAFTCVRYVRPNLEWAVWFFSILILDTINRVKEIVEKMFGMIGTLCGCDDDDDDD